MSFQPAIRCDASPAAKHRALELLSQMLCDEYPCDDIVEIVEEWGPDGLTRDDFALMREVFPRE